MAMWWWWWWWCQLKYLGPGSDSRRHGRLTEATGSNTGGILVLFESKSSMSISLAGDNAPRRLVTEQRSASANHIDSFLLQLPSADTMSPAPLRPALCYSLLATHAHLDRIADICPTPSPTPHARST